MEALIFLTLVVPFLLLIYGAFILFIRAPKAVLIRSLLGGLIMGVLNILVDVVAYFAHWWHYELVQSGLSNPAPWQASLARAFTESLSAIHVPLPFYLTPILITGSLVFLLIWRFWFGKGRWFSILLLVGTPIFCILRDISGGLEKNSYQVWENIPLAIVATVVFWLVAFYVSFWFFWRKASHVVFTPVAEGEDRSVVQHELNHGSSGSH